MSLRLQQSLLSFINLFLLILVTGISACSPVNTESNSTKETETKEKNTESVEVASEEKLKREAAEAAAQEKTLLAQKTIEYWKSWKSLREKYFEESKPYSEEYSIENSQKLSSLVRQLGNQLSGLSAVGVDAELSEVAAEAAQLYQYEAVLYDKQADILSKWVNFRNKAKSGDNLTKVTLSALLNKEDRLAGMNEVYQEQEQIKKEFQENYNLINQSIESINVMKAKRDALKIKLESKYGISFD